MEFADILCLIICVALLVVGYICYSKINKQRSRKAFFNSSWEDFLFSPGVTKLLFGIFFLAILSVCWGVSLFLEWFKGH
jgi:hypothetical protein